MGLERKTRRESQQGSIDVLNEMYALLAQHIQSIGQGVQSLHNEQRAQGTRVGIVIEALVRTLIEKELFTRDEYEASIASVNAEYEAQEEEQAKGPEVLEENPETDEATTVEEKE